MNDFADDPEARLTALLLGELDPAEADRVRAAIDQDPNLARLYEQLSKTVSLVREAQRQDHSLSEDSGRPAEQHLSEARRRELLTRFKTVPLQPPSEAAQFSNTMGLPLQLAALVVLTGFLAWFLVVPTVTHFRAATAVAEVRLGKKAVAERTGVLPSDADISELQQSLVTNEVSSSLGFQVQDQAAPAHPPPAPLAVGVQGGTAPSGSVAGTSSTGKPRPAEGADRPRMLADNGALGGSAAASEERYGKAARTEEGRVSPLDSEQLYANAAPAAGGGGGLGGGGGFGGYVASAGDALYGVNSVDALSPAKAAGRFGLGRTVTSNTELGSGTGITQEQESPRLPVLGDLPVAGTYFARERFDTAGERGGGEERKGLDLALSPADGQPASAGVSAAAPASLAEGATSARESLARSASAPRSASDDRLWSHNGRVADEAKDKAEIAGLRFSEFSDAATSDFSVGLSPATAVPSLAVPESAAVALKFRGGVEGDQNKAIDLRREVDEFVAEPEVARKDVANSTYDPYFLQTESEKVLSKRFLGQVVERLEDKNRSRGASAAETDQQLSRGEAIHQLRDRLEVVPSTGDESLGVRVKGENREQAAEIAQAVAEVYRYTRDEVAEGKSAILGQETTASAPVAAPGAVAVDIEARDLKAQAVNTPADTSPPAPPAQPPMVAQPETVTAENPFSTFSMNVADVSFRLAAASLEGGQMPEPAAIRSEEFLNAFDYRDPWPAAATRVALAWSRSTYPFAHHRDLLRLNLKTAAQGREPQKSLNLVLCLDNSGSMERADRVNILHEALTVLAAQLRPTDIISVVTFARTARLCVDGLPGVRAADLVQELSSLNPEGGTNLEEALRLAYETARNHFRTDGVNRVVLLTDGAANLGNVDAATLRDEVVAQRQHGIALDCFGIGWEGYNDDLLENLTRNGDGRYGFLNSPADAATGFAAQLAGALQVAASDVKVQVEFNPRRVTSYRQIGYVRHQLTREQFRDNAVDAAEIGAAESGNALYVLQTEPNGDGPIATVRVRYRLPQTDDFEETEWVLPYEGAAVDLGRASPAMRLAAVAGAFSERLAASAYASEITSQDLLNLLRDVPGAFEPDSRPKQLEWMIRQAGSITGN